MNVYLANGPVEKQLMIFMGKRASVPYEEVVEFFSDKVDLEEFEAIVTRAVWIRAETDDLNIVTLHNRTLESTWTADDMTADSGDGESSTGPNLASITTYLSRWPQGCYFKHFIDHCAAVRQHFHGEGRERELQNFLEAYIDTFELFEFEGKRAVKLRPPQPTQRFRKRTPPRKEDERHINLDNAFNTPDKRQRMQPEWPSTEMGHVEEPFQWEPTEMGRVEDPLPARTAEGFPVHRQPKVVSDNRFEMERKERWVYCDGCGTECNHNYKGDFFLAAQRHYHKHFFLSYDEHMFALPLAAKRAELWEKGSFDARWYCIQCYGKEWQMNTGKVAEVLGFTARKETRRTYYELATSST